MKYCLNCGHPMEDTAAFCTECGTPAAPPREATANTEYTAAPDHANYGPAPQQAPVQPGYANYPNYANYGPAPQQAPVQPGYASYPDYANYGTAPQETSPYPGYVNYGTPQGAVPGMPESPKTPKKTLGIVLAVVLGLALVGGGVFAAVHFLGDNDYAAEQDDDETRKPRASKEDESAAAQTGENGETAASEDPGVRPTGTAQLPTGPTQTTEAAPTEPDPFTRPTEPVTAPTDPFVRPTEPATQTTEPATQSTEPASRPTEPATQPEDPVQKAYLGRWLGDLGTVIVLRKDYSCFYQEPNSSNLSLAYGIETTYRVANNRIEWPNVNGYSLYSVLSEDSFTVYSDTPGWVAETFHQVIDAAALPDGIYVFEFSNYEFRDANTLTQYYDDRAWIYLTVSELMADSVHMWVDDGESFPEIIVTGTIPLAPGCDFTLYGPENAETVPLSYLLDIPQDRMCFNLMIVKNGKVIHLGLSS